MWVLWIERLENHWIDGKQLLDKGIGAYREAMKTVMLERRGIERVYEETEEEHSMCEMRWRLGLSGLVSFFFLLRSRGVAARLQEEWVPAISCGVKIFYSQRLIYSMPSQGK